MATDTQDHLSIGDWQPIIEVNDATSYAEDDTPRLKCGGGLAGGDE